MKMESRWKLWNSENRTYLDPNEIWSQLLVALASEVIFFFFFEILSNPI